MYSSSNNQTTQRIYNLIDDIQAKLMRPKKSRKFMNRTYNINNNDLTSNENLIILRNQPPNLSNDNIRYIINPSQSQSLGNNFLNTENNIPNDNDIRRIVREEFNILISSFKSEVNNNINNLDNKINIVSKDCLNMKNDLMNNNNINSNKYNLDIENSLKEINQLIKGFVPYNEFMQKNKEILDQIALNKSNINLESKKGNDISTKLNNLNNDYYNINQKIQELTVSLDEIKNKLNNFNDNYNNEISVIKQNNNKILTNEIKLNDISNKNNFIQKKLDEYYKDLNDFKNNINILINSNNEKFNNLSNQINIEKENNKSLNSIKNINDALSNDLNNINKEIFLLKENMKKFDGINFEEISKFDPNKINNLIQECEEIRSNNPKIYEILEKYNVSIIDLNTKLNKLNEDYENQTKKRNKKIYDNKIN